MVAHAVEPSPTDDAGITVGVTGQQWRASVSAWGAVTPWAEERLAPLDWAVAADDRWHLPSKEAAVRQRRFDGTPVIETRVRIPDGDAVHRVWSVADRGGLTVIEIENDSPLPFAVAFFGRSVLTERSPSDVLIQGIDLPDDAVTMPIAHHTSIRVAIPHGPLPAGVDPHAVSLASLPSAATVARGWSALTDRASRIDLPDVGLAAAVTAARCDLMLEGPVRADDDPIGFVLDVGELVRCGDEAEPWLVEIVGPLEAVARGDDPQLPAALDAAHRIAVLSGDRRAARDIAKMGDRVSGRISAPELQPFSELERGSSAGRFVASVERRLVSGGDVLPVGLPSAWLGVNFELHGVPTSSTSTVSIAVRWHGERPAVLWEQTGDLQRLTAVSIDAAWSAESRMGEGLWDAPRSARATNLSVSAGQLSVTPQAAPASPASRPVTVEAEADAAPDLPDINPGADPDSTSFS
ncbi:MAG: hypothetical protein P8H61_02375 [Ilumatobacter sp.]|nr:hypothetical protein [Ilumatobacter sp.]